MTVGSRQGTTTPMPEAPLPSVGLAAGSLFVLSGLGHMKIQIQKQRGFSLIELLIVVAIILTIAAISIPNLLRARIAANEASAVSSLRALNTAQIAYSSFYPTVGFATTLSALGGTVARRQVRVVLA